MVFQNCSAGHKALLMDKIHFHWHNKISRLQKIQQLDEFLNSSVSNSDQERIFTAVESSFRNIFNKEKATHIYKFSLLYDQRNKVLSASASDSRKFILNLSKHVLTDSEEAVLMKGLNFSVAKPRSNLDMACAMESVASELPQTLGKEFRWKIRSMLEKSRSSIPNMNKKELKAVKYLRLNKEIRIL
jgi:hypothetical protein